MGTNVKEVRFQHELASVFQTERTGGIKSVILVRLI
jgi:hypothetical protein